MILTQVIVPYISKKFLRRLEQTLQCSTFYDNKMKDIILALIPILQQFINGMCITLNVIDNVIYRQ